MKSSIPRPTVVSRRSSTDSLSDCGSTVISRANSCVARATGDGIQVAVRLRPMSHRERSKGEREVFRSIGNTIQAFGSSTAYTTQTDYTYEVVHGIDCANDRVYDATARPVIQATMTGFNGTVFAYGVTSSGKTYTMMGDEVTPGIVPLAMRNIFSHIKEHGERKFVVRIQMLELYNEVVNDLLEPSRTNLKLCEDARHGVCIENVWEEVVTSVEHALMTIDRGNAQRKVSRTIYNDDSSRSHTIVRVLVESSPAQGGGTKTVSMLNLIDLAGSESAKAALNRDHQREGSFINKSLLTLGTVISKLSSGAPAHVPFRDSKLTRLLQASLAGNGARIAIICNVTPAASQAEETLNTLKFASRAKQVQVQAKQNVIAINDYQALAAQHQQEAVRLKAAMESLSGENQQLEKQVAEMEEVMHAKQVEVDALKIANAALQQELQEVLDKQHLLTDESLQDSVKHADKNYLEKQLKEAHQHIADLATERDELLQENDVVVQQRDQVMDYMENFSPAEGHGVHPGSCPDGDLASNTGVNANAIPVLRCITTGRDCHPAAGDGADTVQDDPSTCARHEDAVGCSQNGGLADHCCSNDSPTHHCASPSQSPSASPYSPSRFHPNEMLKTKLQSVTTQNERLKVVVDNLQDKIDLLHGNVSDDKELTHAELHKLVHVLHEGLRKLRVYIIETRQKRVSSGAASSASSSSSQESTTQEAWA